MKRGKFYQLFLRFSILTILLPSFSFAQSFGKNKVQYKDFSWQFVQSKHFDVYYTGEDKLLAEFAADVAESSYVSIQKDFRFDLIARIPIIVYSSHNDFQQTNVTYGILDEGVGGFTEIFKDRIVLPFQGNYKDFRHVIHHELTHAVMFQLLYGGGMGSMVTGMAMFQVPLWFAEGLAEYESIGWDTESDMYMRDAVLNGYTPEIPYLNGFLAYKGGQSVLMYLAEKYGSPKIGEVLGKVRANKNMERGFRQSIGLKIEELTKDWHKYLKRTYWPDIEGREEPEDIAKKLTDHTKGRHFLNNAPVISPKGDKIIYLSDKSDYMDIHMMSTFDGKHLGKLVKGQRSDLFESLHWLSPGMGWSPDAQKIVFAAKSGSKDALYILDIKTRRIIKTLQFDLDGIYSPDWSPDGDHLAFMGFTSGHSDLYLYDLKSDSLSQLTDDVFSDKEPTWSVDGQEIAFISDRGDYLSQPEGRFEIQNINYKHNEIYTIDIRTREIKRETRNLSDEKSPAFSPDSKKIAFISDENGIYNIHMLDREKGNTYPITNQITGISQLSWSRDGSRLAFSSFYYGGFDIYLLNNPLDIEPGSIQLKKTAYLKKKESLKKLDIEENKKPETEKVGLDYSNYVFGDNFQMGEIDWSEPDDEEFLNINDYKDADGNYIAKKYKVQFTPDLISGGAGYSQFYGLQGSSMFVLSDLMGNHQIQIYTDLFYNIKNSNFQLAYYFLPKQTDLGISIFHYSYLFYTYVPVGNYYTYGFVRDRYYGASLYMSRPFSRYRRVDFGLTGIGVERDYGTLDLYGFSGDLFQETGNAITRRLVQMSLGYTTDTVLWGTTGPVNGGRSNLRFMYSPLIDKNNSLEFWTIHADFRKYFRLTKDYSIALRFAGGISEGRNPQRFLLGGMDNWINYEYSSQAYEITDDDYIFLSSFETPFRGYPYYAMIGNRFVLSNIEFRFPLLHYLILGWPLPMGFSNIRGCMFMDIGSAWENTENWKPFDTSSGMPRLQDMKAGYGLGMRVNLGFFLLRYDAAWQTDWVTSSHKPRHYFSMGAEF